MLRDVIRSYGSLPSQGLIYFSQMPPWLYVNDINHSTKSLEELLKLKEQYCKSVRSKPQMKKKAIIYALTIHHRGWDGTATSRHNFLFHNLCSLPSRPS